MGAGTNHSEPAGSASVAAAEPDVGGHPSDSAVAAGNGSAALTVGRSTGLFRLQRSGGERAERRRLLADAIATVGGAIAVAFVCWGVGELPPVDGGRELATGLPYAIGLVSVIVLMLAQVYRSPVARGSLSELARVIKCVTLSTLIVLGLLPLLGLHAGGGSEIPTLWLGLVVALYGARLIAEAVHRDPGPFGRPTLVIGRGDVTKRLADSIEAAVTPVDQVSPPEADDDPDRDGAWWQAAESALAHTEAEQVVIDLETLPVAATERLVRRCSELKLHVALVPSLQQGVNRHMWIEHVGVVPLLHLGTVSSLGMRLAVKHAYERLVAAALLIAFAPVFGMIAIAIKATSRGPVLYRQRRVGQDGQEFELLKFRSMREARGPAEFVPEPGMAPGGIEGDDRTTLVGRFLRKSSLDELPQLINVARGEMSLVGPRPERPEFVRMFRRQFPLYDDRHRLKAGITGWAQVHGLRGQTPLEDRLVYDNYYIENWSHSLDLKIMLLTIPALLRGAPERTTEDKER